MSTSWTELDEWWQRVMRPRLSEQTRQVAIRYMEEQTRWCAKVLADAEEQGKLYALRVSPDPSGEFDTRYYGPCATKEDASACGCVDVDDECVYDTDIVEVEAIDPASVITKAQTMVNEMNEEAPDFFTSVECWADWEDDLVELVDPDEAQAALEAWARKYIRIKVWREKKDAPTNEQD